MSADSAVWSVPQRCDLSAGIKTSDAAGTVTFRLAQADPDFLYKLALPLASAAPPGAPGHAISRAPFLPGTGPYMISQVRPNKPMTLVRNPYFRQWSYAAQPAGYPSIIRYERVTGQSADGSAVIADRADLAVFLSGGDRSLAVRYPARFHYDLKMVTTAYAALNTRQPPFSNIKARQAISYAIDRARIIQLFHLAPGQVAAACQMLPPDFPGHQPRPPLHGRRWGRGLARPGHGEGATAGNGIPDYQRAGDRLELRYRPGQGGRLLPGPAPEGSGIPGQPARGPPSPVLGRHRRSSHQDPDQVGGRVGPGLPCPVYFLRPPAELPVG